MKLGAHGATFHQGAPLDWRMRYAALASGSKGNCHALSSEGRTLLVDAGLSLRQIRARMDVLGWNPEEVRAVAITHEHSDHVGALGTILRRTDWAVIATRALRTALQAARGLDIPPGRWIEARPGLPLDWDGWRLLPFALPHDAEDPVAYRLEAGGLQAAVVTDLGYPTALVADHCQGLDLLVLEANHDLDMLRDGAYPPHLKARILSRVGHLSNGAMADLLARSLSPRLQAVVLAHLSEANNHPDLARLAAAEVLGDARVSLQVAHQLEPLALAVA